MSETSFASSEQPRLPTPVRLAVVGVAGLTALASAFGVVVGIAPGMFGITEPMWILAGFESVILAAAVFGGLVGLGRFRDGQAITLGCSAATIAIAALLGSLSLNNTVGSVSLGPFLVARFLAAGVIAAAMLPLTLASRQQWLKLGIGALVLSPVAVLTAPIALTRVGIQVPDLLGAVSAALEQAGPAISLFATLFGGLVGIVAISIGGHLVITAFDKSLAVQQAGTRPGPKATPKESE